MSDVVQKQVSEGVALLTLNRPDRLNAWTAEMEQTYFGMLEECAASSDVRVIVVSMHTDPVRVRRALEAGATDFLCKPFDHTEVALRIGNLLQSRHVHLMLDNQCAALEEAIRDRTAELRATIAELQKTNELLSQGV